MAMAMVLSLSVSALAANEATHNNDAFTSGNPSTDIAVSGTYTPASDGTPATMYSVKISWTLTNPSYSAGTTTYTWNPSTTTYETPTTTDAGWTKGSLSVTVENSSNAKVWATATLADETGDDVTLAWDGEKSQRQVVESAASETDLTGDSKVFKGSVKKLTFSGALSVTAGTISASDTTLGTVTVTLYTSAT